MWLSHHCFSLNVAECCFSTIAQQRTLKRHNTIYNVIEHKLLAAATPTHMHVHSSSWTTVTKMHMHVLWAPQVCSRPTTFTPRYADTHAPYVPVLIMFAYARIPVSTQPLWPNHPHTVNPHSSCALLLDNSHKEH